MEHHCGDLPLGRWQSVVVMDIPVLQPPDKCWGIPMSRQSHILSTTHEYMLHRSMVCSYVLWCMMCLDSKHANIWSRCSICNLLLKNVEIDNTSGVWDGWWVWHVTHVTHHPPEHHPRYPQVRWHSLRVARCCTGPKWHRKSVIGRNKKIGHDICPKSFRQDITSPQNAKRSCKTCYFAPQMWNHQISAGIGTPRLALRSCKGLIDLYEFVKSCEIYPCPQTSWHGTLSFQ